MQQISQPAPNRQPKKPVIVPEWLRGSFGFFIETLKVVIISLAIILPIRYFLVQPFYVRGASMEPTFNDFEYLLIDEISYRLDSPQRGDVIVFKYPLDTRQYFIKRVIGLPGETIDVLDGHITIKPKGPGAPIILTEDYLPQGLMTDCLEQFHCKLPITLKDNQYFGMGDNRTASLDSRYFGVIPRSDIVGRAWVRLWPFSHFRVFKEITYPS